MYDVVNKRVSKEAWAWFNMLCRCANQERDWYKRGIKVCERWLLFENFLSDVGRSPSPEHSLDRINNDGNYEPDNCRWATASEQMKNRRPPKRSPESIAKWIVTMRELAKEDKGIFAPSLKRGWNAMTEARREAVIEQNRKRRQELKEAGLGNSSVEARANASKAGKKRYAEMTEEQREELNIKISRAQKDRPLAPEHVKALQESYEGEKGAKRRKLMSEKMKNRTFSEETRRKMSEAAKKRVARDGNPNPNAQ